MSLRAAGWVVVSLVSGAAAGAAHAGSAPADLFVEGFEGGPANWFDGIFQPVEWFGSGSFDGSAYASAVRDLASGGGFGLTVFRAQEDLGSSGGGFTGNYIAGGITTLSFRFRHDAPEALAGFVRFAPATNNPAVVWSFAGVPSGEWTEVTLALDPDAPNFIPAGGTFGGVMSNVGNVQFAVTVPGGLTGEARFDIDQVSIVPGPGGLGVVSALGVLAMRRRRR
ncbi:MAG: hypothetical protein ACTS3F_09635 [Phycisphaerales bacterium]